MVSTTRALAAAAGCAALAAAMAHGAAALAQTSAGAGEQVPAGVNQPNGLEEIVVTARRRKEAAQDVPISVTAISAEALRQASVSSVEDLERLAPGLHTMATSGRANQVSFVIRGQAEETGYITNDPAVGVYFAEAVQMRPQGTSKSLYDLESVQVLKGPQGTLFGRNTTGGAVLIQPNRPQLGTTEGYVEGTFGNYDRHSFQGAINLPVGSVFAIRLASSIERQEGYVTNLTTGRRLDGTHSNAFRGSFLFDPGNGFRNTLYVDTFNSNQTGTATEIVALNPALPPGKNPALIAALASQQRRSPYDVQNDLDPRSKASNYGATNLSELDLGEVTLKNIFNYRRVSGYESLDSDGSGVALVTGVDNLVARQYSEELQVLGKALDSRLQYIAGAYYFRESGTDFPTIAVGATPPAFQATEVVNVSKSVFAQADYEIVPRLTATLGGRFTWDSRSIDETVLNRAGTLCTLCASLSKDFSAPTWTGGLQYKLDKDVLLYLTNRRGYRSGGFNGQAQTLAGLTPYRPETVTDVEFGVKADWQLLGAPIRTNLAVYKSYYNDIQRQVAVVLQGIPTRTIYNAAKATITGGELELTYLPLQRLELSGFYGYTDGRYQQFTDPASGQDLSGLPFARTPKVMWRLAGRYELPFARDFAQTHVGVNYQWTDQVSWNDSAILPGYLLPSYGLLNARIEFDHLRGSNARVSLYVNNITNTEYRTFAIAAYPNVGYTAQGVGAPRMYGVELGYRF
jgi:iron complex outermembrane receptor protein